MNTADVVLALAVLTLCVAGIARRFRTPMPVVLASAGVVLGIAWRLVPGLPPLRVPADRVLLLFLPPLLTSAAHALPLQAVWRNLRPILLLAVGLVLATIACTAAAAHLVPGFPWVTAFVLGAIVAPPDPVAATAVGDRMGLRHELIVILEGEGLINDAVAIAAYHVALATALGTTLTLGRALGTLALEAPVGIACGAVIGWITVIVRGRLDDATLEGAISLLVPYLTYVVAEDIGGSAVLAVVTLGFVLQAGRYRASSPTTRLATRTIWSAMRFASTALVFLLLGFLIGEVVAEAQLTGRALAGVAVVAAVVISLRLVWMLTVPRLVNLVPGRARPLPATRELAVLGWAGMRGVVSLALALALPAFPTTAGVPNDARHLIILITFGVIVATLILQGATLLPLVRVLGIATPARAAGDEERVRRRARRAGLAAIARESAGLPADMCHAVSARVDRGEIGIASDRVPLATEPECELARRAIAAEREVVERSRAAGRIGEALAEQLAAELDLDESRLAGDAVRFAGPGG